jgi:high-affinity K+ transport system ATPase subunit B
MRTLTFCILISFLACQNKETKATTPTKTEISTVMVDAQKEAAAAKLATTKDSTLLFESRRIVGLIAQKNYAGLAETFHPDGVRFSLYGYVDTTSDLVLKAADFVKNTAKKRTWGMSYGDETPIVKNTSNYFKQHVYDVDFLSVIKPTCNAFTPSGSSVINTAEAYKGCDYVEFHKIGTNPKFDGMDWKTLQIVFKKDGERYKLIGVIHNEWMP